LEPAVAQFQKALALRADVSQTHNDLAGVLLRLGRPDEALVHFREALRLHPDDATVLYNIASLLLGRDRFADALAYFERAAKVDSSNVMAHAKIAWVQATCPQASLRDGGEAIRHAERANQLCDDGKRVEVLATLAAAYAEAGLFPQALRTARRALAFAAQQNSQGWADLLRTQVALYERGKPFRQPLARPASGSSNP
jgi:Flp pilus assembly protein TadD